MIRLFVADTQRLFADSFGTALGFQPDFKVLAHKPTQGPEALDLVISKQPDISLIDYWMPRMGGPAIASMVSPKAKVILMSWFYGPQELQNALGAGAAGFLPKNLPLSEVVQAVRRIHSGSEAIYPYEFERLSPSGKVDEAAKAWRRLGSLTPREVEVLRLLGLGLTREQIGTKCAISPATVRTHVANTLRKLEVRTQMEAIATARDYELIDP